ncbi:hypothetical protein AAFC00_004702 [Neodothiora populina]|uniref:J domain-containing protein n=1 Tax=Neodothiora populina TaxID=2781224 RepID=A0ABR3P383_9PEZI
MASPLPPDPYAGLGVEKDATAAQIKSIYRKLVLKCHPDKVTDPALKAKAADDFHRIQQAYEILSDQDRRTRYDAQVKLAALRRDVMEKKAAAAPSATTKPATRDAPSPVPGRPAYGAAPASYSKPAEPIYEDRKPSRSYEADHEYFPDNRTFKKREDYDKAAKRSVPRDRERKDSRTRGYERSQQEVRAKEKEREKAMHSERHRARDKEVRRERGYKTVNVHDESESDDVRHYSNPERGRRRDEERVREKERERDRDLRERELREREARDRERERELKEREREKERVRVRERERDVDRERPRDWEREEKLQRDKDQKRYEGQSRKTKEQYAIDEAKAYMNGRTRGDARPSAPRTASMGDAYTIERPRDVQPPLVRRTSVRPKTDSRQHSPPPSSRRDRERERMHSVAEGLHFPVEREPQDLRELRRPPGLEKSTSSPAGFKPTLRAATLGSSLDHAPPLPPQMHRSETMPAVSSKRKDAAGPHRSSTLRQTEFNSSGLPTPIPSPEEPAPSTPYTVKQYRYTASPDNSDYNPPRRTAPREPLDRDLHTRERRPADSPSPGPTTRPINPPRHSSATQPPPLRPVHTYYATTPTESPTSYSRTSPIRPSLTRRESVKSQPVYADLPRSKPDHPSAGGLDRERTRDRERERERGRERDRPADQRERSHQKYAYDVPMASGYTGGVGGRTGSSTRPTMHGRSATAC